MLNPTKETLDLTKAALRNKMTPEEAINAATINSAHTLELSDSLGSICTGKTANLFITEPMADYSFIPYSFGTNRIETVILNGKVFQN